MGNPKVTKRVVVPKKFQFDDTLVDGFPNYMVDALKVWCREVMMRENLSDNFSPYLSEHFVSRYQIATRAVIQSRLIENFLRSSFGLKDNGLFLLDYFLRNYGYDMARRGDSCFGKELEDILSSAGSMYASELLDGQWRLVERVPEAVKTASARVISANVLLADAWRNCYGVKPQYDLVVQRSIDVLEALLKEFYLPDEKRPQLGKNIKSIESMNDLKMQHKGVEVLDDPKIIFALVKNLVRFRGEHTSGNGKSATKEVAEYALNATIFIWNLHN